MTQRQVVSRNRKLRNPVYVPDTPPAGGSILGEPDSPYVEARLLSDPDVLWIGDFYESDWKDRWGIGTDTQLSNQHVGVHGIEDVAGSNSFRAKNPANTNTGFGFHANFANMGLTGEGGITPLDEVYFRYRVYFPVGYAFQNASGNGGGKLPGLAGKNDPAPTNDSKVGSGGQRWNNATELFVVERGGTDHLEDADGFSARLLWHKTKKCQDYIYCPSPIGTQTSSKSFYGASTDVRTTLGGSTNVQFVPGTWHTLEQRVVMNTPGVADGIEQVWFDGTLGLQRTNVMWRGSARSDLHISELYFGWFFGGGAADQPATDQYVYFKDAVLSTAYIGPRGDV